MATHEAIEAAARLLEAGGLVAFPTETVYGLGADAENPQAVASIYAAKGRPSNHPVIVHLAPGADLTYWARDIPAQAQLLIDAFWPGPLTLILKRAAHIPSAVSGGQDSIGLRCPSHPVAQALLRVFKLGKGGVAAPSANKFGHVSPTTAQHVRDEFGDELSCVLDGGQSDVGIESTIVDLSRERIALLRPGQISAEQIAAVLGVWPVAPDVTAPRVSGALDSHYAPRTPVALIASENLQSTLQDLATHGRRAALMSLAAQQSSHMITQHGMPADPVGYAHELYAALRAMDLAGADIILVETPPQDDDWQGINDRLRRAAFGSSDVLDQMI
ncbi:MAG TPA: L-threonylcarbamoyladenylate synthase [Burkholderiaceae bacterium]|jgi:L-threonylcarbamoyladenylate synthase|nr:L-threonylcarbamoyladenylate synthase [Burkholderiaceae bacterium]